MSANTLALVVLVAALALWLVLEFVVGPRLYPEDDDDDL